MASSPCGMIYLALHFLLNMCLKNIMDKIHFNLKKVTHQSIVFCKAFLLYGTLPNLQFGAIWQNQWSNWKQMLLSFVILNSIKTAALPITTKKCNNLLWFAFIHSVFSIEGPNTLRLDIRKHQWGVRQFMMNFQQHWHHFGIICKQAKMKFDSWFHTTFIQ